MSDQPADGNYQCPASPEHTTIPRPNTGDADLWCIDCHEFRDQEASDE